MSTPIHISVVTPVYLASGCVVELYRRLVVALEQIDERFEIIMVDDGSPDDCWQKISDLGARDARVIGIRMSRNFGQHFAIAAGLDAAQGNWVVVMDCDLQDQPEEIAKLYDKAQEGFDIVFARRHERKDSFLKKFTSKSFSLLYNYLGDIKLDNAVANFSLSSHQVIRNVRQFKEHNRSFPAFLHWVGFRQAYVDVDHAPRFAGQTSYSLNKLLDFAIQCIVSQSNKPLRISIKFGFAIAALSILYGCWSIVRYYLYSVSVEGWTSLMVVMSLLFGLLFANMGILGLYLGKVFDEVKGRPLYMVSQRVNMTLQTNASEGCEDRRIGQDNRINRVEYSSHFSKSNQVGEASTPSAGIKN